MQCSQTWLVLRSWSHHEGLGNTVSTVFLWVASDVLVYPAMYRFAVPTHQFYIWANKWLQLGSVGLGAFLFVKENGNKIIFLCYDCTISSMQVFSRVRMEVLRLLPTPQIWLVSHRGLVTSEDHENNSDFICSPQFCLSFIWFVLFIAAALK